MCAIFVPCLKEEELARHVSCFKAANRHVSNVRHDAALSATGRNECGDSGEERTVIGGLFCDY